jgi:predicted HicB family RNase H-like nuclease
MNTMTVDGFNAKIEYDEEPAIAAQAEGKSINLLPRE